jgi:hypothetical protein
VDSGTTSSTNGATTGIGARFDPLADEYLADPYPFLVEARRAAPIFYSENLKH